MAEHGAFLELMQLVDAGRKVRGRDSMEIADADVVQAKAIDRMVRAHDSEIVGTDHDGSLCPTCAELRRDRVMFRLKLESQGQDFPVELLS